MARTLDAHQATAAYTAEEEGILDAGLGHLTNYKVQQSTTVKLQSTKNQASVWKKHGDADMWGRVVGSVNARPIDVLAFVWNVEQRCKLKVDDLEKSVEERGVHNQVVYIKKRFPYPLDAREFFSRVLWRPHGRGFLVVSVPEDSASRAAEGEAVVRARYRHAMLISKNSADSTVCSLEHVMRPEFGGKLPNWAKRVGMQRSMGDLLEIQSRFQGLNTLEDWDEEDGKAVGVTLVTKTEKEKRHKRGESKSEARVRLIFEQSKGLRQLGKRYGGELNREGIFSSCSPARYSLAQVHVVPRDDEPGGAQQAATRVRHEREAVQREVQARENDRGGAGVCHCLQPDR